MLGQERSRVRSQSWQVRLITDLIDVLGKVTGGLKAIVNLPKAEREFRLCRSLRVAMGETETLASRLTGVVNTKDWDDRL